MRKVTLSAFGAALLLLVGCGDGSRSGSGGKLPVVVSVIPQKVLVERIGGGLVDVSSLVEAGQDPHHFSATPKQVTALNKAQVIFTVGMPFEAQYLANVRKAKKDIDIVDTTTGMALLASSHCAHDHDHDHDHGEDEDAHAEETDEEHDGEVDPHVWLSPELLKLQAKIVSGALASALPKEQATFEKNLATFLAELDQTKSRVDETMKALEGKGFYVFHPAFAYFARDYGLEQHAVESDGQAPSPKELVELIAQMREQGAKVIFSQPQFDERSVQKIAEEIGATVVMIDPLAPDIIGNIEAIATAIAGAYGSQP